MRTPFINSRAMAMTLALEAVDDEVRPRRPHRRVRRTRAAAADERRA
jgi:hypothetical protein